MATLYPAVKHLELFGSHWPMNRFFRATLYNMV